MIKILNGFKVNLKARAKDYQAEPLICGDKILYARDHGYILFGWYIGSSLSGKTNYMMSENGYIYSLYYLPVAYNWKESIPKSQEDSDKKEETLKTLQQYVSESLLP